MIVIAKLKAKSGEEAKIEEALRGMVAKVGQEQGTLTYTLHSMFDVRRSSLWPCSYLFLKRATPNIAPETFNCIRKYSNG